MRRLLLLALFLAPFFAVSGPARAEGPAPLGTPHLACFGAGEGPRVEDGVLHLLDEARTPGQSNAIAFDRTWEGAFDRLRLEAKVRVLEGGDGGAILFLATKQFGVRGPGPFLTSWVEPNLGGSFAVGLDVHDPPSKEVFTSWGNYEDRPQREVSLHWDGREIVKRVAPEEFRGRAADLLVEVRFVVGGAEIDVRLAGAPVYEGYFVAGMAPYETRLAFGAGTRADATTTFDLSHVHFDATLPAAPRRPPLHVEVFDHVRTDNAKVAYEATVDLPPADWAFGRVLMTIDLHDAGAGWDEWDRNGEVSVFDDEGNRLGIVPFITSYRTPCHWVVDVTHFRPLLTGRRRLEIAAGTTFYMNRGYLMSVSLDYHHGIPEPEPFRVVPLWHGTAAYGSDENHFADFFPPRDVSIDPQTVAARLYVTTTGHSQVGEFTPSQRTIAVGPAEGGAPEATRRYEDRLWKTDCYLNPNRPQFGTWQYARAGWAPGDVVRPWIVDLAPCPAPGQATRFAYTPGPYEFPPEEEPPTAAQKAEARQVVRAFLVLYRAPGALVTAPILRVAVLVAGGNAAKAGIAVGDYLASYDGVAVTGSDDLRAAIQAAQAAGKERVEVVIFRGSTRTVLELPPGLLGVKLAAP